MYQKLIIIGNLGGDPNMRYTVDGKPVTSFEVRADTVQFLSGKVAPDEVPF